MRIGHFDETEQNDDVDVVDDMDENIDDADENMDDADEDMEDTENDIDSPEYEDDGNEGSDSGETKKSLADMIKDKISSIFQSKETGEDNETQESEERNEAGEKEDTDGEQNRPFWELSQEEKEEFNANAAEIAKKYREDHNLGEHGEKLDNSGDGTDDTEAAITHGDDGERVREMNHWTRIDDDELER